MLWNGPVTEDDIEKVHKIISDLLLPDLPKATNQWKLTMHFIDSNTSEGTTDVLTQSSLFTVKQVKNQVGSDCEGLNFSIHNGGGAVAFISTSFNGGEVCADPDRVLITPNVIEIRHRYGWDLDVHDWKPPTKNLYPYIIKPMNHIQYGPWEILYFDMIHRFEKV
ncbi:MAG: hypothetical protein OEX81_03325 [Candidatus Pacebacteria bacterium]|nr:hypothetical protein [Candidatus Paceibacterota bacterium]